MNCITIFYLFNRQLLGSASTDGPDGNDGINGTFTFRRRRPDQRSTNIRDESLTDADDEILESLVKTATKTSTPRPVQRERKRTRNADRKSCKKIYAYVTKIIIYGYGH